MPHEPLSHDADDDYELEAPDESVEQLARQRAAAEFRHATDSLEIDNAQRAMEERHMLDPSDSFQFQFQTKHLLIATAVLAIGLTLAKLTNGFAVLMVGTTVALIITHWYLNRREQQRIDEAAARRAEVVRRSRERQATENIGGPPTMYDEELEEADAELEAAVQESRFRLSFSFQDMMIAVTVAAVVMGIGAAIGAKALAVVLGLVAVTGLLTYAVGVQPPARVVMVWWVTLLLYIVVCVLQAIGTLGGAAA
ncbi:hypothetical protein Pla123a_28650 [Posidoniimonas polymericola]|uniref:Uncharacterized protein n=1 Tax=Posidoniimonas polymericola TaxID=2528002 RepID=A0A5C5YMS0_9BACT|nr:hypothetical protein [Posidoniimonas polymericola]TWT76078.1 hypothetical protein Pla123a_28650 [Posidoniimonas polymericola]